MRFGIRIIYHQDWCTQNTTVWRCVQNESDSSIFGNPAQALSIAIFHSMIFPRWNWRHHYHKLFNIVLLLSVLILTPRHLLYSGWFWIYLYSVLFRLNYVLCLRCRLKFGFYYLYNFRWLYYMWKDEYPICNLLQSRRWFEQNTSKKPRWISIGQWEIHKSRRVEISP